MWENKAWVYLYSSYKTATQLISAAGASDTYQITKLFVATPDPGWYTEFINREYIWRKLSGNQPFLGGMQALIYHPLMYLVSSG